MGGAGMGHTAGMSGFESGMSGFAEEAAGSEAIDLSVYLSSCLYLYVYRERHDRPTP